MQICCVSVIFRCSVSQQRASFNIREFNNKNKTFALKTERSPLKLLCVRVVYLCVRSVYLWLDGSVDVFSLSFTYPKCCKWLRLPLAVRETTVASKGPITPFSSLRRDTYTHEYTLKTVVDRVNWVRRAWYEWKRWCFKLLIVPH